MKSLQILIIAFVIMLMTSGCVLTRIITMPMRVIGSATTILPIPMDPIDETIDEAADTIDKIPI